MSRFVVSLYCRIPASSLSMASAISLRSFTIWLVFMPETPQLDQLIKRAVREGIARVHTQVPGRVLEYDHETQKAKIQLIVEHAFDADGDGEVDYYKPAPLVKVPVKFPAILTWPIEKGQPGWVEFSERSIDEYEATGNDNVRPSDLRRFDLSDAVFFPCFLRGEADADSASTILSSDDLKVRSSPTSTTSAVAISPAVESFLRDFITQQVLPHIHSDPLTGTTGPSPGPFTPPTPGEFDSANVESE